MWLLQSLFCSCSRFGKRGLGKILRNRRERWRTCLTKGDADGKNNGEMQKGQPLLVCGGVRKIPLSLQIELFFVAAVRVGKKVSEMNTGEKCDKGNEDGSCISLSLDLLEPRLMCT